MTRNAFLLLFGLLFGVYSKAVDLESKDEVQCRSLKRGDASYDKALNDLTNRNEFKQWERSISNKGRSPSFIEDNNVPVYRKKRCYWVFDIYEKTDSQLIFWKSISIQTLLKGDKNDTN